MNNHIVYSHICPNGKCYIGITGKSLSQRSGKNGEGYKRNRYFWKAIQKYGWDNFQHLVLIEGLSKEEACECEKYLISKYMTNVPEYGYNIASGGQYNSGFHFHHTDEAKRKISKASKGHITSYEQRKKISIARKGKFHPTENAKEKLRQAALNMTGEQKKQISKTVKKHWEEGRYNNRKTTSHSSWNKGLTKETDIRVAQCCRKKGEFHHTQEARQKMSLSHKGKIAHNRRPIMCIETNKRYEYIGQAFKETGINNIGKVLKTGGTAGGFHWRYLDE